ncbi:MAG: hypothetical protein V7642_3826 [Burkholderiales bacterium]|jgi:hypothetical protein
MRGVRDVLPGLMLAALCLSGVIGAQAQTTVRPSAAAPSFAGPLVFRGTLGDEQIQVNLRPKADAGDGYEGDYFIFGSSQKVLLAGDLDKEDFAFEESENGTDISGQWEGKLSGDTISGTWQSADGSNKKPFNIKVLRTDAKAKKTSSKPAR